MGLFDLKEVFGDVAVLDSRGRTGNLRKPNHVLSADQKFEASKVAENLFLSCSLVDCSLIEHRSREKRLEFAIH